MMGVAVALSLVNSAVLAVLLVIYGRMAIRTKANYAFGLFIFALLLLLQSALTVAGYLTMTPSFGKETLPLLSGVAGLELVGLVVLVRITL